MIIAVGVNMLAGALAGISEHTVMFPIDSIKVSRAISTRSDGDIEIFGVIA